MSKKYIFGFLHCVLVMLAFVASFSVYADVGEGGSFSTETPGDVWRYGTSTAAEYKQFDNVTSSFPCSSDPFGGDPQYGTAKSCSFYTSCAPGMWNNSTNKCTGCSAGDSLQSNGTCQPTCSPGKSSTASYYDGRFSTSTTSGTLIGTAVTPKTLCDGQCTGNYVSDASCQSDTQASVSNPSAVSCVANITLTGEVCSGSNGSAPVYSGGAPSAGGGSSSGSSGSSGGSSTGSGGTTNTGTGSSGTTGSGTSGSGTSDSGSSGTNGSGTSGTNGSGTGSGNGTTGQTGTGEQAVKVDETGTPSGYMTGALPDQDTMVRDRQKGFDDNTKVTGVPWTMTFSLPDSSCNKLSWSVWHKEFDLDVCPFLGKCRDAWGYCLYGLCAMYLWRRATGSVGSQGG